jgi:hypothetical protein
MDNKTTGELEQQLRGIIVDCVTEPLKLLATGQGDGTELIEIRDKAYDSIQVLIAQQRRQAMREFAERVKSVYEQTDMSVTNPDIAEVIDAALKENTNE